MVRYASACIYKRALAIFLWYFTACPSWQWWHCRPDVIETFVPMCLGVQAECAKPSVAVKFMTSNTCSPLKTSMRGSVLQWAGPIAGIRLTTPHVQITFLVALQLCTMNFIPCLLVCFLFCSGVQSTAITRIMWCYLKGTNAGQCARLIILTWNLFSSIFDDFDGYF